ncbi:MAG: hypothetical protein Q8S84_04360 [bacterium]|nr:hypothetical protein [bacterium]
MLRNFSYFLFLFIFYFYTTLRISSIVVYHFIAFNIPSSFIVIKSQSLAFLIISSADFHSLIRILKSSFKVIIS